MGRILGVLCALFVLSTCGSPNKVAPRNMDNACSIISERAGFLRAFERAEKRWGVPVAVQMATIYQESKFISNAKTPRRMVLGFIPGKRVSSAKGYSQALDGTWDDYRQATGNRLASRTSINDAADFMGWYMDGTKRTLGIPTSDARRQYLAYHEGRGGYRKGTYKNKSWLMRVAADVEARAIIYDRPPIRAQIIFNPPITDVKIN